MLTQAELQAQLNYDPETGIFTWKISKRGTSLNAQAGTINSNGYVIIGLNQKIYRAHRLAWLYIHGEFPKEYLDHINGNRSDNRLCNLREANNTQNQWNAGISKNNTSGIKGVAWRESYKSYRVRIRVNGKQLHIGYFKTIELAKEAAEQARLKFHKQFVNHGE